MPRGELVGDAYIRITADTTAMRRALKREAAAAEASGAAAGKGYTSEFGKGVETAADKELAGARAKIRDALTRGIVSGNFDEFADSLGGVEPAAARVRAELTKLREEGKLNAREFDVFNNAVEKWSKSALIEERAKKDAEALRNLHTEALEMNKVWDRMAAGQKKAFADMQAQAIGMNREFDRGVKERERSWNNMITEAIRLNKTFDADVKRTAAEQKKAWNDMLTTANRMNRDFDRAARTEERARVAAERLAVAAKKVADTDFKRFLADLNRTQGRARDTDNVFHSLDKSLTGLSRRGGPLVDLFTAPLRAAAGFGSNIEKLFKPLTDLAGDSAISGFFLRLGPSLLAAGGAALVLVSAMSTLVALISSLAAAITVAAVGIGGALTGALLVAAGAVPALGFGLLGLVLLFKDLKAKAPQATEALKQIGDDFKKTFDAHVLKGFTDQVQIFQKIIQPMSHQLAAGLGDAFARTIETLVKSLRDPRIKASVDALVKTIPQQVGILGDIFVRLLTGLVGFFKPIEPFVTRFLNFIDRIATSFSKWANSVEGQNKIATFMQTVFDQASLLGQAIVNVATAIGGIFNAGKEEGTGFLQFLADITQTFSDFVNSAEGQKTLNDWFQTGILLAKSLGGVIQTVVDIFKTLNTAAAFDRVLFILGVIKTVGDFLVPAIAKVEEFGTKITDSVDVSKFDGLIRFFRDMSTALSGPTVDAFKNITEGVIPAVKDLVDSFAKDFVPALESAKVWLIPLAEFMLTVFSENLVTTVKAAVEAFKGLFKVLGGLLDIVTGLFTNDWSKIGEGFKALGEGLVEGLIGLVTAMASGVTTIIGHFFDDTTASVTGQVTELGNSVGGFFSGIGDNIAGWWNTAVEAIGGAASNLGGAISGAFETARLAVGKFFTDLGENVGKLGTSISDGFTTGRLAVGKFFTDLGTSISDGFTSSRLAVGGFFSDLWNGVIDGANNAVISITEFFTDLPDKIVAALGTATGWLVNWFFEAYQGVIAWRDETLLPFITGLPEAAADAIRGAGNWIQQWWMEMYDGLVSWWTETFIPWVASLPEMAADAVRAFGNWIQMWWMEMYDGLVGWFSETVLPWISSIAGTAFAAVVGAGNWLLNWFSGMWDGLKGWVTTTFLPWVGSLPGALADVVRSFGNWIQGWWMEMYNGLTNWFTTTFVPWVSSIPGIVGNFLKNAPGILVDWFSAMWGNLMSWWSSTAVPWLSDLPRVVGGFLQGIGSTIGNFIADTTKGLINDILRRLNIFIDNFNNLSPFDMSNLPYLARGGLIDRPTMAMVGEAGREMVVPLDRPLSQIDESVRWLAAIAQGKTAYAAGGVAGGASVNVAPGAINVVVPNSNPVQVASAVLDRVVAGAFV